RRTSPCRWFPSPGPRCSSASACWRCGAARAPDAGDVFAGRPRALHRERVSPRAAPRVELPVRPPLRPMLAKRANALPAGDGWIFEPKWDGFRVLVFRAGDELLLQSRDEKPLDRYFPELRAPLAAALPARCVLDGELVVARNGGLDFEALQQRIHPAASRVARLARETPASIVFFDLLAEGDRDLRPEPFRARRRALEAALGRARPPLHLTPATEERRVAADWFGRFEGAGLDGVVAKGAADPYQAGQRALVKVKHERECDCVVAG